MLSDRELNVSVVSLQVANDISKAVQVRVGMCLTIPEDAPPYGVFPALDNPGGVDPTLGQGSGLVDGEEYVVQPGDTLDVIAQAFDVSAISLELTNNLVRISELKPGMTLIIPADAPRYGVYPAVPQVITEGESYTVQRNDTLVSIAEQFNVPSDVLRRSNNIDSTADIFPGRVLLIPDLTVDVGQGGGQNGELHIVQPRDTIDTLGAFYNKDVRCIIDFNQIEKPPLLQPGQTLVIPDSCGIYVGEGIPPLSTALTTAADSGDSMEADEGDSDTQTEDEGSG